MDALHVHDGIGTSPRPQSAAA